MEKNINFLIDHQCPQCGAPAVIRETDRLFSCEYCRVRSYLLSPDVYRFVLPVHKAAREDIIYVPYWRFKGMLFSCVSYDIRHRIMDLSRVCLSADFLPMSLGLRSQALKLKYVSSDVEGRFLKPTLPLKSAMAEFAHKFEKKLPKPVYFKEYIGEALSLIYAPVYAKDRLYDAVINEPITISSTSSKTLADLPRQEMKWHLNFLATLCPSCGWDLEGETNAATLLCRNCDTAWMPFQNGFKEVPFAGKPDADADIHLPFWRIQADVSNMRLETVKDMIKTANLPKVTADPADDRGFFFWVMAFKVRPHVFLRIATAATMAQPDGSFEKRLPEKQPLFPANLPVSEAMESLKLILGNFSKPREVHFPKLAETRINPKAFSLIYLPFTQNQHEYINTERHITIMKSHMMRDF